MIELELLFDLCVFCIFFLDLLIHLPNLAVKSIYLQSHTLQLLLKLTQCSLRSQDLDRSLDDLGLDVQSLEELSLLGVKASGAVGDSHIRWGQHALLGVGRSCLLVKDLLDFAEITIGEDHADVANELLQDDVEMGAFLPPSGSFFVVGHAGLGLLNELVDGTFHVGLLISQSFGAFDLRSCP